MNIHVMTLAKSPSSSTQQREALIVYIDILISFDLKLAEKQKRSEGFSMLP